MTLESQEMIEKQPGFIRKGLDLPLALLYSKGRKLIKPVARDKEARKMEKKSKTHQFIGLFLLGNFLFSYPILTLFNTTGRVGGIPLFFLYFFFAWALLIVLMIRCTRETPDTTL